jgi:hypothetical protein
LRASLGTKVPAASAASGVDFYHLGEMDYLYDFSLIKNLIRSEN